MKKRMLVNATGEEIRVAVIEDRLLHHLHVEHIRRDQLKGNIYRGVVVKVEPAIQAAFVDYGASRNGFLAAGDLLPHWYAKAVNGDRRPRLEEVLRKGHPLLVQVLREEDGNKGAALTTRISLPGRYVVLMPHAEGGGVSRKIEDEEQRHRLKEIQRKLSQENGDFGLIVRTVGIDQTKTELERDLHWLEGNWKSIERAFESMAKPGLVYREQDVVLRALRDYFTTDIDEVVIDDEETFQRVADYVQTVMPRHKKKFSCYQGDRPLFAFFGIESQIDAVYQRKVPLKSGGALVIDRTEALVAIDVNSGRSLREKDMEATALRTNLEAAEEVARQLRLRDLGGLIVIDFIDLRESSHRRQVEKAVALGMKQDKARHLLGKINEFGLLVLSRQRIRPPLDWGSHEPCPTCHGRGMVRSVDAQALEALRALRNLAVSSQSSQLVRGEVAPEVATNLLNRRRNAIIDLERRTGLRIEILPGRMSPGDPGRYEAIAVDPLHDELEPVPAPAPVAIETSGYGVELEPGAPAPEPPVEATPKAATPKAEPPKAATPKAEPSKSSPPDPPSPARASTPAASKAGAPAKPAPAERRPPAAPAERRAPTTPPEQAAPTGATSPEGAEGGASSGDGQSKKRRRRRSRRRKGPGEPANQPAGTGQAAGTAPRPASGEPLPAVAAEAGSPERDSRSSRKSDGNRRGRQRPPQQASREQKPAKSSTPGAPAKAAGPAAAATPAAPPAPPAAEPGQPTPAPKPGSGKSTPPGARPAPSKAAAAPTKPEPTKADAAPTKPVSTKQSTPSRKPDKGKGAPPAEPAAPSAGSKRAKQQPPGPAPAAPARKQGPATRTGARGEDPAPAAAPGAEAGAPRAAKAPPPRRHQGNRSSGSGKGRPAPAKTSAAGEKGQSEGGGTRKE
ncbi:MAG: Rne/Rng family ribonuclease [Myxococcota bacterium]|jgi:ribonuclease E|nr:Rne/Rng family ribonuclease [Myxococcota bacterium]